MWRCFRLLYRAILTMEKKARPVILLGIMVCILFYYMFENELDMLNSHADMELLPHISRDSDGFSEALSPAAAAAAARDRGFVEGLLQADVLLEKNKYFPLLLDSWEEASSLIKSNQRTSFSKKLKYWELLPRVALQSSLWSSSNDYGTIQADKDLLVTDSSKLADIKTAFLQGWDLYKQNAWGHDYVRPFSLQSGDDNHLATTMILSLETLYLMGETEEARKIIEYLENFKFDLNAISADWKVTQEPVLGALLSAYELSGESILLDKAVELADIILLAFDTPNGVPMVPFNVRSPLTKQYAYRRTKVASLAGLSVTFTRLSQLTKDQKYFNAIYYMYDIAGKSVDQFDLPGLLTDFVDASGCEPKFYTDSDNAESGTKSIYKGRYVNCIPFQRFSSPVKVCPFSPPDNNAAEKTRKSQCGKEELNSYSWEGLADWYESLLQLVQILNEPELVFKFIDLFERGIDSVMKYMIYEPSLPDIESAVSDAKVRFVSSVRTWRQYDAIHPTLEVKIMRNFDMTPRSCSLSGVLTVASKVFKKSEDRYMALAKEILNGCIKVNELWGFTPKTLYVDQCEATDCVFDEDIKRRKLQSGAYNLKGNKEYEDIIDSINKASFEPQSDSLENEKSKSYSFYDLESVLDLSLEDWDDQRPLFVNKWDKSHDLNSELIGSIFYMFRTTGDPKWRKIAWQLWETLMEKTLENGAKGIKQHIPSSFSDFNLGIKEDYLPPEWFSKTLKYFYLIFSDGSDIGNLDEWLISTKGNLVKKTAKTN
ncbi:HDL527Cp [Eremothecium sinecaudum]|uniref:alpha-1,2-Mannosidase n=1 Tax=Eremothecium sinecaudum TaxID=45286 RepID=A0A0X8HRQ6_9SACH|nr:HDL527Cp [Eremothecium sinecaudum]AMD20217.1 HDL527Cp [Eremothecium sinecaudum]